MTKRTADALRANADNRFAHRGYLIHVLADGSCLVTKDGHTICRPRDVEDAKRQIAAVLD